MPENSPQQQGVDSIKVPVILEQSQKEDIIKDREVLGASKDFQLKAIDKFIKTKEEELAQAAGKENKDYTNTLRQMMEVYRGIKEKVEADSKLDIVDQGYLDEAVKKLFEEEGVKQPETIPAEEAVKDAGKLGEVGKDTVGVPKDIIEKGQEAVDKYVVQERAAMSEQVKGHRDFAEAVKPPELSPELQEKELSEDEKIVVEGAEMVIAKINDVAQEFAKVLSYKEGQDLEALRDILEKKIAEVKSGQAKDMVIHFSTKEQEIIFENIMGILGEEKGIK